MKILVVGPHPDDLEYGCGGTLLKLAAKNHKIHLLVMTSGEMGGDPGIRKAEQQKVARYLGAELYWGKFSDTDIPLNKTLIDSIEKFIFNINPDITFVPSFDDTHQDHRKVSQATTTATRYLKNVLFYEVPTTTSFAPTIFQDISDVVNQKLKLLEMHTSQVSRTNIAGMSIMDFAKAASIFRGFQNRCQYAEGFVPMRMSLRLVEACDL
ncbi:MAG: PIG-L family deacetylase [Elusimicrobia bacterium]|nr:PIG-L family deacetylase [Elusimicrobiota bacterium]MBD3412404.1 PIG-L family deacetylase [Elusimicrobiota bacterium]